MNFDYFFFLAFLFLNERESLSQANLFWTSGNSPLHACFKMTRNFPWKTHSRILGRWRAATIVPIYDWLRLIGSKTPIGWDWRTEARAFLKKMSKKRGHFLTALASSGHFFDPKVTRYPMTRQEIPKSRVNRVYEVQYTLVFKSNLPNSFQKKNFAMPI